MLKRRAREHQQRSANHEISPELSFGGGFQPFRRFIDFIMGLSIFYQAADRHRQFLRSMIPHHAGAILMYQQAAIGDSELEALCKAIVSNQQSEIDLMKAKLKQLDR